MANHAPSPAVDAPLPDRRLRAADLAGPHRGRLFRKYLALILTLVCGALVVSGAITIYFAYQDNKSALADLQHEKAIAAASRIEQYIGTIDKQLRFAALPQIDAADVDLRRIEFLKLLRQAPEVTDIAQIDGGGHELLAVSRVGMDVAGSRKDRSQEAAFRGASQGRTWFGPVYFRKETEPYMTLAVRTGGENGSVTIADVNLKFIWDVVSRIKIGGKGKAYVVDRNGFLVADPDIGLVLRKTDLTALPHVKSALQAAPATGELATVSTDVAGTPVLASFAKIEPLDWNVFVEQPVAEVYAKLNASILRTALLILVGLVVSGVAALALARGMVRPIGTLSEGARRIGAGDLDQQIIVRTGDELEALADHFNRMTAQLRESYASLERKVEERTHELQSALEQQTAISDILRVISSSPTDVQPVLETVAERAAQLCDAPIAQVVLVDGELLRPASVYAVNPDRDSPFDDPVEMRKMVISLKRSYVVGRAVLERRTLHFADILPLLDAEFPDARPIQQRFGFRALMAVPLMREAGAYGAILIWRREARSFSPDQIALLETFARQAAIAIDNVRLFNETKEALEQQTAIGEILRTISSSPTDVQPVLDAVAERAAQLCAAPFARVVLVDGDVLRHATDYSAAGETLPSIPGPLPLRRSVISGRAILDRETIHHADIVPLLESEYSDSRESVVPLGARATLAVPLIREGGAYGAIFLFRREPRLFTPNQVALVQTFARQAAIAIDNVRLFNETKEALEQQTAIAEILRVISSSPTDMQPVLDAIAERAARLCDASAASMYVIEGGALRHLASKGRSPDPVTHVDTLPINRDSLAGRAVLERLTIQVTDLLERAGEYPLSYDIAKRFGHRTVVVVPLLREGQAFGTILLRREEVRPFSEREIALLRTFGDQAAIAIENVRLFNETKEALDQQRASGEVLATISSSISDTSPVFEKILASCERLFAGKLVRITLVGEDGLIRLGAYHGPARDTLEKVFPRAVDDKTGSGTAILRRTIVQFPDVEKGEDVPEQTRVACRATGVKSIVFSPMIWEGRGIGAISIGRDFTGLFSDKDIALLKTFADQAVIAIQNARLFNETKEALDQQRASGEVLAAISNSIADTTPVFERIVSSCERLFAGKLAVIDLVDEDGLVHLGAYHGPNLDEVTRLYPHPLDVTTATGTAIATRRVVHYPQLDDVPELARRAFAVFGIKAAIGAPMLWEGKGIGAIWVARDHAGPFSAKDIALLKTFADQAVIAIQNARLFNETKEALEQQRASGEVLGAISSSVADTKPVFEVILASCQRLFAGHTVGVTLVRDDGMLDVGANAGADFDALKKIFPQPLSRDTASGIAILDRRLLVYADIEAGDMPAASLEGCRAIGTQSIAFAPMLFEDRAIGTLWVGRSVKGTFSDKQLALLKTFADQAVIAIQNARLFREIQEKSRQLEVANKHKSDFLASMSHELRTPLNAIIGFSEVLLERLFGDINAKQDDYLKDIHSSGTHLLALINDILDLSKVEAGRMELDLSHFDLPSVISGAMTLVRERALQHGIRLEATIDPQLGAWLGDERKVKQILLNLLSNAVKFTPDGGRVDVTATLDGTNAVVAVRDTGIGIAPEDQAAVFEEFRQVGDDYTRKQEGTGLGLALTRKFIELHGGRIWIESAPREGSVFTFTLPSRA